ncbi:hypothetical protein BCR44DRAFT_202703 [Catenaria anguillulae PL171]|uniref:Uncharacterized protein n=1 Tax=Catenaria anguillulae PL171 TaxID=765915 RepID=A0A1Y2HDP9_9FUNG|nr:hypothetical protein BCR44DRAFT_202703 [Catenaria anguillulae PL171]
MRKCLCLDIVPGVKLLLAVQIIAGIALAYMSVLVAQSAASISPRILSYANLTISDRDYLALMTYVSGGLGAWSSLLALFGLVCAVRKNLQGFKLFAAVYWGYIFAGPLNLAITYLSFSGSNVSIRVLPASIASCVIQFYWGLCFAGFVEALEEEKEKELLAESAEEVGETPAATQSLGALESA